TCTIVTTSANELLKPIHDRMPVILTAEGVKSWLDVKEGPEEVRGLLTGLAARELGGHAVSRAVNNARAEGEELIRPVKEEEEERQTAMPARRKEFIKKDKEPEDKQGSLF